MSLAHVVVAKNTKIVMEVHKKNSDPDLRLDRLSSTSRIKSVKNIPSRGFS